MENDEQLPETEFVGLSELEIQEQFLNWNDETQKWERKFKLENFTSVSTENNDKSDIESPYKIEPTTESEHYLESKKKVEISMLTDYAANVDFTVIYKPSYNEGEDLSEQDQAYFVELKEKYHDLVKNASDDASIFDLLLKNHPELTSEELDQKFLSIEGFKFEEEGEEETKEING